MSEQPQHPQRRRWLLFAGVLGVPTVLFVLWWFEPQALLVDDVVDEDFPGAPVATAAPDDPGPGEGPEDPEPSEQRAPEPGPEPEPSSTGPVELATGSFESRNRYTVTGTATTFELEDGQRVLRLEDFESTNGPDLFVYLTAAGTQDDDSALEADVVDLGVLTGNIGNQNYVIPADVDLDRYSSVVIWCRRFATSFGVADLA